MSLRPCILLITSGFQDYLSDGVLHGLRQLLGPLVVDYPKADPMYCSYPESKRAELHGRGFSLYGMLDDINIDRTNIPARLARGEFNLVVFGDIYRSWGQFLQWQEWLQPERTMLLDGADVPAIFPHAGRWWRRAGLRSLPSVHRKYRYFKREWTPETLRYRAHLSIPRSFASRLYDKMGLHEISFSIPDSKVCAAPRAKTKLLTQHIVDPELAQLVHGSTRYVFDREDDYYNDLQVSRFGVTTRRAGWDCLRHYEIAANGCVPCFRDLQAKPSKCAPHGLDETNCISYRDSRDLVHRLENTSDEKYAQLQRGALEWARAHTTVETARRIVDQIQAL